MGKTVECHGLHNLEDLQRHIETFEPDLCFNLIEEFEGDPNMDMNIVSLLEMMGMAYTGCNPKGLMIARDKSLSKKVLEYHHIPTPQHFVVPLGEKAPEDIDIEFPLFVKSLNEEASLGIAQASVVKSEESLEKRVHFIHEKLGTDAIVDEFIDGRELYLAMLGGAPPQCFPLWELDFGELERPEQKIASRNMKWNEEYREKNKIDVNEAKNISPELANEINENCIAAYEAMEISGYVRFDLRLRDVDDFFIIEANPNPNIGEVDEFALAAQSAGIEYQELLDQICRLAIKNKKPLSSEENA